MVVVNFNLLGNSALAFGGITHFIYFENVSVKITFCHLL